MTADRRRKNAVSYLQDDDSSDDGYSRRRSTRSRGSSPRLQRAVSENPLIRKEGEAEEKDDHQWDTDYDPRDKYYLSAEDSPFDPPSTGRRGSSRHEHSSRPRELSRERRSQHHDSPSRSGHTHSRPHEPPQRDSHSHSQSHTRDNKDGSANRRRPTSQPKPKPSAARPRPRPLRANSSYLNAKRRPRATRAGSSHAASRTRPRPVRDLSQNGHKAKPSSGKAGATRWENLQHINWEEAAKVALQAGTVAACKVGAEPIPWTAKGTKIASAALGAAVVDHILQPKKKNGVKYSAIRYLTEVAMGSIVVGPALGKVEQRRKR